jgi:F0F1-type ATP synthase assembly protein I
MAAPQPETPLEKRLRIRQEMEERGRMYRLYMQTSVGGLEVGLSVVVGALLGYWADRSWQIAPWGTLVGVAFGIAAGARQLYRLAKKHMPDDEEDEDTDAEADA